MHTECRYHNLSVVYQDESLVAIHKPAGLLVHRSPIDKHETQFAVQMTRDLIGQDVFPVHRLDKPTSGLLLFTLNKDAARHLGEQFMQHSLSKTYWAICRGWAKESGHIDHALKLHKDKIADKARRDEELIQDAFTDYRTLATTTLDKPLGKYPQQRYSLLELKPQTGRKHQLRRHMNFINHPIIGDVRYGDRHHNHLFNDWLGIHRLYLAATQLDFIHPDTVRPISIKAPLEDSFQHTMQTLKLTP